MAKIKKARKPSKRDKEIKAKRTGYRFKTEGNPKLHKKDGSLNKKGEELYYKKPSAEEIEKYKKKNNEYSSDIMQIYHERRANRKHSDDNLSKKFGKGGGVKQNKPQSESYSKKADKLEKAKPVGMRFTDKLAKKLGKSPNATPTKKDVEKYLGKGVYDEKRKDKSDVSLKKKFNTGGGVGYESEFNSKKKDTIEQFENKLNEAKSSGKVPRIIYEIEKDLKVIEKSEYKFEKSKYALNSFLNWVHEIGYDNAHDKLNFDKLDKEYRIGSFQGLVEGIRYHLTSNSEEDFDVLLNAVNDLLKQNNISNKVGSTISDAIKNKNAKPSEFYTLNEFSEESLSFYANGGGVKQNKPQSESYSKKADKLEKAKPVGKRYTNELADELGKSHNATPTKKDVENYLGNGVYDEKRKDKSDVSLKNKFEEGGETEANIELSVDEMKASLGREPKYPYDFIKGKKYVKCFLRPYYKLVD